MNNYYFFMLAIIGFSVTCLSICLLKPIAKKINLIDIPDSRKQHTGAVPLIGGLAMLIGLILGFMAIPNEEFTQYYPFFISIIILVLVGFFDDLLELTPRIRLFIQAIAILIMMYGNDIILSSLGNLLGFGEISVHWLAIPLTLFAALSLMNAVNMLDGLDGLAGLTCLIAYCFFLVLSIQGNRMIDIYILSILISVIIAFLLFNLQIFSTSPAKIFMGDAGSLLLGFTVVWFSISLTQGENAVASPVTMLWILAIPLLDLATVFILRLKNKKSPFEAGLDHIHHLLQYQLHYSKHKTVLILSLLSIIFGMIGLVGHYAGIPDSIMFLLFIGLYVVYYQITNKIWLSKDSQPKRNHSALKVKNLENVQK